MTKKVTDSYLRNSTESYGIRVSTCACRVNKYSLLLLKKLNVTDYPNNLMLKVRYEWEPPIASLLLQL